MNGPTRVGHWLDLHGLGLLHRFIHWAYCLNLAPLLIPKKRVASATSQGGGGGGPPPTVTYWISTYNNSNPAFALETQIPTLSQAEGDAQGYANSDNAPIYVYDSNNNLLATETPQNVGPYLLEILDYNGNTIYSNTYSSVALALQYLNANYTVNPPQSQVTGTWDVFNADGTINQYGTYGPSGGGGGAGSAFVSPSANLGESVTLTINGSPISIYGGTGGGADVSLPYGANTFVAPQNSPSGKTFQWWYFIFPWGTFTVLTPTANQTVTGAIQPLDTVITVGYA